MPENCKIIIAGYSLAISLTNYMDGYPSAILPDVAETLPELKFGAIVTDEQVEAFAAALCKLNQSHTKPEIREHFADDGIELGLRELTRYDILAEDLDSAVMISPSEWDYIINLQDGTVSVFHRSNKTSPRVEIDSMLITYRADIFDRMHNIMEKIVAKRYNINGASNYIYDDTRDIKVSRILVGAEKEQVLNFINTHGLPVEEREYWDGVCNDLYLVAKGSPVVMEALLSELAA